ncbi:MAG TPA: TolC family protein [Methylophilus sp.]|nr:TolC family protein [Methylophilus sp.]HQQ33762.1 TolC family protein [Methylophilus sp.]
MRLVFAVLLLSSLSSIANPTVQLEAHEDEVNINPRLSLSDVLSKTYERNPQQHVLSAMAGVAQARDMHAKGVLPNAPAVTFRHQNDTIGSNRGERESEVEMEMPVWLPGQRAARQALAKDLESGLGASRKGLKLQLAGILRDAVWDVRMNQDNQALYESRLKTAQKLEQDVAIRFRAGELAKTDLMLVQNETLQAEAAYIRAQAEVKHAKHRYIALTGLNEMPENLDEMLSELSALSDQHPLLEEANAKIEVAKDERQVVAVERRDTPQFILSARSQRGPNDNFYNDGIGFKVRIPFASDTRNAPLMASAESNLASTMAERDKLRLSMETALHEAEHNLLVTRKELELVTRQNQITLENVQLARKAFKLGETDLVSLLRSESQAFEAERVLSIKKIQLQWDIARYNQAVGVLP